MSDDHHPAGTRQRPSTERRAAASSRSPACVVAVIGAIMLVGGAATWVLVQSQLSDEQITVVRGRQLQRRRRRSTAPSRAYPRPTSSSTTPSRRSKGKTYAELDREDPVRATVMNGSFLRASLFTSVLAFGVSAMAMGLGFVQILLGLSSAASSADQRA